MTPSPILLSRLPVGSSARSSRGVPTMARAIVGTPRLLLADEPTGNLDSKMGEEIMQILEGYNREAGVTVIMVTHDQRLAERTERIVRLFDGRQVH
jgi:putative ABC transport system ATP-binding protein